MLVSTFNPRPLWQGVALVSLLISTDTMAQDFRDNFPTQFTETPMGVNLQTGKFRYHPYDFSMGPFVLERGFNKMNFQFLGDSYWTTTRASNGGENTIFRVQIGELKLEFFKPLTGGGAYWWFGLTIDGWVLKRVGQGHELTSKSGIVYYLSDYGAHSAYDTPSGRVTQITYPDGSIISVEYGTDGTVQFLRSNRGYAVRYEKLQAGAVNKVCGFNLARTYADSSTSCSQSDHVVSFSNVLVEGALRPASMTDLEGRVTTFQYASGQFKCATLPDSPTCEFINVYGDQPVDTIPHTRGNQVRMQTDAAGRVYHFDYEPPPTGDDPPPQPGGPPIITNSWMWPPGVTPYQYGPGQVWAQYETGLVTILEGVPGGGPHLFEYNGIKMKKAIWPDGNDLAITFDGAGNAITNTEHPRPGSDLAPLERTQKFYPAYIFGTPASCDAPSPKLCDKPLEIVDARGKKTEFTYDPAHGGVLTKTSPLNPAGIKAQTRYEYAQRSAVIKNAGGAFVPAGGSIWVLSRERFCRSTAASGQGCSGGATDEVVTDYDYGPTTGANNLLLRGQAVTADRVTLRTCYSYDANGRRISETKPRANLAVCP